MSSRPPIRFVTFDLADTLLHKPDLLPRIDAVLRRHAIRVEGEALRRAHYLEREARPFPARPDRAFYQDFNRRFLRRLGVPDEQASEALALEIHAACQHLPWRPFPDVAALGRLGVPAGVLSNWDDSIEGTVRALLPFPFAFVLGSAACGVAKPDPAFFTLAARRSGVAPGELLHVGDSVRLDIEPALAMGAQAVLLDRFGLCPDFAGPGHKIRGLDELAELTGAGQKG